MVGRVNRDGDWKKQGVYMKEGTNGASAALIYKMRKNGL